MDKMVENAMLFMLEEARQESERYAGQVYAIGNGKQVTYFYDTNKNELMPYFESKGFWLVSIFQNGHRVEA